MAENSTFPLMGIKTKLNNEYVYYKFWVAIESTPTARLPSQIAEEYFKFESYLMFYVCIFEVLGRINFSGHWRP